MQIAQLFARIGLKTDEEKAKSFTKNMNFAKVSLFGVIGAAAGASAAIVKFSKDAMDGAASLRQFEVETGASAQELQRWQAVAEQTNQTAESVSSAIRAITSNQEKIRLGGGDISGYQLLNIDPRQDPFEILDQLREKTDGLSQAMKRNILSQMGISASMIQTLELSREEFDAMASRAFIISPEAIETLTQSKAMMDQAARGIQYLKTQIAVGLAPGIKVLTENLIEFIKANEAGFIKGFQKAFQILTRFLGAIGNTVRMIDRAVSGTIGWANALKILLAVMLALNASFWASPIGLIVAGIILLVAVLDDLYVYSQGGQSLFGEMMEKFPGLEGGLKEMVEGFIALAAAIKAIWTGDYSGGINEMIESWGIWGRILEGIVNSLEFIKEGLSGELSGRIFDRAGEIDEEGGNSRWSGFLRGISAPIGSDDFKEGWGAVFGRDSGGSSTTNNDVTINIDGAGDPAAVGREVDRQFQGYVNGASAQRGRNE